MDKQESIPLTLIEKMHRHAEDQAKLLANVLASEEIQEETCAPVLNKLVDQLLDFNDNFEIHFPETAADAEPLLPALQQLISTLETILEQVAVLEDTEDIIGILEELTLETDQAKDYYQDLEGLRRS
ncbi:hypothetical protein ACS126_05415 [Sphingobacterium lactis]|uniref:hypothetical protein n=1 Tax=Sphingobacterium lactis TaxID=797291 RepID=UPI003EC82A8C